MLSSLLIRDIQDIDFIFNIRRLTLLLLDSWHKWECFPYFQSLKSNEGVSQAGCPISWSWPLNTGHVICIKFWLEVHKLSGYLTLGLSSMKRRKLPKLFRSAVDLHLKTVHIFMDLCSTLIVSHFRISCFINCTHFHLKANSQDQEKNRAWSLLVVKVCLVQLNHKRAVQTTGRYKHLRCKHPHYFLICLIVIMCNVSPTGTWWLLLERRIVKCCRGTNQITFIFTAPHHEKMISEQLHVEQVWTTLSQSQLFPPRASTKATVARKTLFLNGRVFVTGDRGWECVQIVEERGVQGIMGSPTTVWSTLSDGSAALGK